MDGLLYFPGFEDANLLQFVEGRGKKFLDVGEVLVAADCEMGEERGGAGEGIRSSGCSIGMATGLRHVPEACEGWW
jgi:hypothetical protein